MTMAGPEIPERDEAAWETALGAAIREVSGLRIPPEARFFDAGLTSVTLVGVFERLADQLPPEVSVTAFFKHPTCRSLARHLAGRAVRPVPALRPMLAGRSRGYTAQDRRDLRSRLRERKG